MHTSQMRLLSQPYAEQEFKLTTFNDDETVPPYAILSHTWMPDQEVMYDDLITGTGKYKAGFDKIRFCARRAAMDGLEYFWVDTCSIDKSISEEVGTAINSMFRWYQRAKRCYVFLSDVQVDLPEGMVDPQAFPITWENAFRRSKWFTRGWTLQELLAPASVECYSRQGLLLGTRITLERQIHEITKLPIAILRGGCLTNCTVAERMSWVADRKTTIREDRAYCLLGIFGIFLPLIYGEGKEHAFRRLSKEIEENENRHDTDHRERLERMLKGHEVYKTSSGNMIWCCCQCGETTSLIFFHNCSYCSHSLDDRCTRLHYEDRYRGTMVKGRTIETQGMGAWAAEFYASDRWTKCGNKLGKSSRG